MFAAPAKAIVAKNKQALSTQASKGDPSIGKDKAENERCMECHGVVGQGSESKIAKLAGQKFDYILKQMQDFKSGKRKHDFMEIMAKSVSDEDLIDIAAYFSTQEKMRGQGEKGNDIAQALLIKGDQSRNIVACVTCHSDNQNQNTTYPIISGQDQNYLHKQLLDWKTNERKNSQDGVMNTIAKTLSDNEIEALASYLSNL